MFNETLEGYKKAFVFGAGGGNDIVSAVLVAMYLQRRGVQTDIGGVLSPAAIHAYDGKLEQVVNKIEGEIKRWIPSKEPTEISFIDRHLPGFVKEAGVDISNFYDLSIRYGTTEFVDKVKKLISDNEYDLVVAVDVGGDILARGPQDETLLSPAMDFTSLYLLSQLEVDSLLVEFGLGTDGELRPKGMEEIIGELGDKGLIHYESKITKSDYEIRKFREIFDKIRPIREGRTAVSTLQTLDTETPDKDIIVDYRFRSRIGKILPFVTHFEITLPHQYFGKVFVIDGKGLAAERRQTAAPYKNPLEQYIRLKQVPSWKTEFDLSYLWSGQNWTSPGQEGYCMLLLIPSTRIPEQMRGEILKEGIKILEDGLCDLALMNKEDCHKAHPIPGYMMRAGSFSLVLQKKDVEFSEETIRQIKQYQS